MDHGRGMVVSVVKHLAGVSRFLRLHVVIYDPREHTWSTSDVQMDNLAIEDDQADGPGHRSSKPAVWQFGPPRTPTSCFPAASSTCIHLSDERQRRHIAPSLHLVNPRYSIAVRRVVQPPNNAVHNVLRSPIGDHDGRHRLLRHGYYSDAFSGLLCLGQFGNQPPLPFILPRSALCRDMNA